MIRRYLMPIPYLGFRYPFYFFHHIPKTGGTAVMAALSNWFKLQTDYREELDTPDLPRVDLSEMINLHCIVGHFGDESYFLDVRYPEVFTTFMAKHKYRCFTFIREPLSMRCSLYRHESQKNNNAKGLSLFEHLCYIDNYTAAILNVNESNYKQRLDRYFFVGTADDLQLSFDHLARRLKKPKQTLARVNASNLESDMVADALNQEQIAEFERRNKLDYLIYEYAKTRMATFA